MHDEIADVLAGRRQWAVVEGDSTALLPTLPDGCVGAVVTDPPYPEVFWPVLEAAAPLLAKVLRPGGELVTLVGHHQLPFALKVLTAAGLRYWWTCGMLHHTKGRILGKYVVTTWRPALWFVKGKKRRLEDMPMDMLLGSKPGKREHEWEQGRLWFDHWVSRCSNPGELVLDPFAGTGTTGVACVTANRRFIGFDIDPAHVTVARRRLAEASNQTGLFAHLKQPDLFRTTALEVEEDGTP